MLIRTATQYHQFLLLAKDGNITEEMMYNTYNMGIGMMVVVDAADVDKTMEGFKGSRRKRMLCNRSIETGEKGVTIQ